MRKQGNEQESDGEEEEDIYNRGYESEEDENIEELHGINGMSL